jgi:glycosyltransferase involved in cell wall biosynthesis
MTKISAYVIAYNQVDKIKPAIESILWADEIIVADSYSTDGTTEIAGAMGARVVQIPFEGFGDLRNQAISACSHEWIFSLDSDERCTPEVQKEILNIIQFDTKNDVYFVPRKNFFMGKEIRHCGYYPDYRQPQLFRKGAMTYTMDPVHESFVLHTSTPPGYLKHAIWQIPFKNSEELLNKINRYSSLGAVKLAEKGISGGMTTALSHGIWGFIQVFFVKKGLLDGWAGFVLALSNFEATFYKYLKFYEKRIKYDKH